METGNNGKEIIEYVPVKTEGGDDFEDAFAEFQRTSSEHKFNEEQNEASDDDDDGEIELNIVDQFKIKMFLGLIFSLLDGFHAFMYSMLTKYKITKEDIELDEAERTSVEYYFQSKKVIALINKIPKWVIGVVNVEYIYFQKFQELREEGAIELKDKHKKNSKRDREEEEEEQEEEQEFSKEDFESAVEKAVAKHMEKLKPAKKAKKKVPVKKDDKDVNTN